MGVFCSNVTDFEKKPGLFVDLIENAFRGSIQNTRLFRNFLHLLSVLSIIFSKNGRVLPLSLAYPQRIV